jgi:hypothetical protein
MVRLLSRSLRARLEEAKSDESNWRALSRRLTAWQVITSNFTALPNWQIIQRGQIFGGKAEVCRVILEARG